MKRLSAQDYCPHLLTPNYGIPTLAYCFRLIAAAFMPRGYRKCGRQGVIVKLDHQLLPILSFAEVHLRKIFFACRVKSASDSHPDRLMILCFDAIQVDGYCEYSVFRRGGHNTIVVADTGLDILQPVPMYFFISWFRYW